MPGETDTKGTIMADPIFSTDANLSKWSINDLKGISSQDVAKVTAKQIKGLDVNQVKALMTVDETIVSLSKGQVSAIKADFFADTGLDATYITQLAADGITGAQAKSMSANNIVALTTAQIQLLDGKTVLGKMSATQIAAIEVEDLQAISAENLAKLSAKQIAGLTTGQVSNLKTDQVAALTVKQVGALTAEQFTELGVDNLKALTTAQMKGVTAAQLNSLDVDEIAAIDTEDIALLAAKQFKTMSTETIKNLTDDQIAALDGKKILSKFTAEQLQAIETQDLIKISTDQLAAINAKLIANLSTDQVANLTTDQVAALTVKQVGTLTAEQFANLSDDGLAALTALQMKNVTAAQLNALSDGEGNEGRLGQLASNNIAAINAKQFKSLSADSIVNLTVAQAGALQYKQIAAMGDNIKSFEAEDVAEIKAAELKKLAPKQVTNFTAEQLLAMQKTQVEALSAKASWSATQNAARAIVSGTVQAAPTILAGGDAFINAVEFSKEGGAALTITAPEGFDIHSVTVKQEGVNDPVTAAFDDDTGTWKFATETFTDGALTVEIALKLKGDETVEGLKTTTAAPASLTVDRTISTTGVTRTGEAGSAYQVGEEITFHFGEEVELSEEFTIEDQGTGTAIENVSFALSDDKKSVVMTLLEGADLSQYADPEAGGNTYLVLDKVTDKAGNGGAITFTLPPVAAPEEPEE
jgi:hypothetical protein